MVDLNDLRSLGQGLVPVRKTSVMPGVPHYEFEKKLTKTRSEPLFRTNRFGFVGKEYGKSFDNDSKIPVRKTKKVSIEEIGAWKKPPSGKFTGETKEESKRRFSFDDTTNRKEKQDLEKSKSLDYTIND